MLYLALYVLLRVAGTGGIASLSRTTVRPGQRQHVSQRTLHRDRGSLALVCVVNCRDDPLATSTTLVRKYRAIFAIRWSDVYCKPQRGVEEL